MIKGKRGQLGLAALLLGPAGIIAGIFAIIGAFLKNEYILLGSAGILTYIVWSANLFPIYIIIFLVIILIVWFANISKGGRRR